MGWAHAIAAPSAARRGRDLGRLLERAMSIAALALVTVWAGIGLLEMAAPEDGAAEAPGSTAPADTSAMTPGRETFAGAYIGAPYHHPSDITLKQPGVHDLTIKNVGWYGEPFNDPIYYGARIVRWGNGTFGGMVDFTHSKALAELKNEFATSGTLDGQPVSGNRRLGDMFRRLEFTHGHNMLTLNGLMRLPRPHARLQPYVGLGLGVNLPHTELQLVKGGRRTYEYQLTGPAVQGLVGIEFRVPRMSYFVEYKFSFAPYLAPLTHRDGDILLFDLWRQARDWWSGTPAPGGVLSTTLTSHQVIMGLGARLAATPATASP